MRLKSVMMAVIGIAVAGGSVYAARHFVELESEAARAEAETSPTPPRSKVIW